MKKFYIFRHGQTDWNAQKRMQGLRDMPLNQKGKDQAYNLIPFLEKEKVNIIYSSPLKRAKETAEIASNKKIPIQYSDKLKERDFGILEGKTQPEVRHEYKIPAEMDFYEEAVDLFLINIKGLEKQNFLIQRIKQKLLEINNENKFKNIGISTHGALSLCFLKSLGRNKLLKNGQVAEVLCDKNGEFILKTIHTL